MCGICGIWGSPNQPAVETMVKAMRHRGPDDSGLFSDERVTLGMSRLAILDLTSAGHQPMSNSERSVWIILNGEIYNFQEKRIHLQKLGYSFTSNSDTEVVLKLYEHYGDDFLLQLRGMFALAIYDKRGKERLLLARDHFGIKPLLYSEVNGRIVFGSEIKAMLASGMISPQVDPEALRLLLTYGCVDQPRTIIAGIKSLLPAHKMIIENGQIKIERYWSLANNRRPELKRLTYQEQVDVLKQGLIESVRMQMVSDVPLGAFLSGGVDSSLLVGILAQEAGKRVKTFSVGFDESGSTIDESNEAKKNADFFGTDHTHIMVRGKDVRENIFKIASGLDQPSVDGVNSYFVSRTARQGVTVAISGTGGDELFAGYPRFINMSLMQDKSLFLKPFASRFFDPLIASGWGRWFHFLRKHSTFLEQYGNQYQIFRPFETAKTLSPSMRQSASVGKSEAVDIELQDELANASVIERVSALCLRGYTSNLLLRDIDAVSMSHSLEVRVPYLDPAIADIALSLPDQTRLRSASTLNREMSTYRETGAKRILVDAGKAWLPKDIDMQPKRGFVMPFGAWLKGDIKDILLDTLSETNIKQRGWFNSAQVESVKERFFSDHISWEQPWLLMMTELWAREVLDQSGVCDG
ncbi:MAG: asparagine synthase (glutamine-hydrolyzing) [Chloroflexi bacterium]|nr:asparagine synthase (glutamine-hydrolyzing) [Chloroflexota bacterium]